jgi:HAMP domain
MIRPATSEISKGNLDVTVEDKGNDELSVLSNSFNSMVKSLKSYIEKQNELTKELENANEELKRKDLLKDEHGVQKHPGWPIHSKPDIEKFRLEQSRKKEKRDEGMST